MKYKLQHVAILDNYGVTFILRENDYDYNTRHKLISFDDVIASIEKNEDIIISIEYEEYSEYTGDMEMETCIVKVPVSEFEFVKDVLKK